MNIDNFVKGIAAISYVPATRLKKSKSGIWEVVYSYPEVPFLSTFAKHIPKEYLCFDHADVKLYIRQEFAYYGFIRIDADEFFMLGPVMEIPIDNHIAQNLMRTLNLPITQANELIDYYENTPRYSVYKFAQILTILNHTIDETRNITIGEILPEEYRSDVTNISSPNQGSKTRRAEQHLENSVKNDEYEKLLYSYVYTGSYEKMKEFISRTKYDGDSGVLSHSVMQQNKYLVITSTALASRAAVKGRLNYNTAMQQADFFYRKVDEAVSFKELFDIHKQMLLSYTKLVAERKLGKPTPPLFLSKIRSYIETHITERITTGEIAEALQMNRSYLSTQFKNECGINLGEYINRMKIDEAKRLMMTTEKSLINIANDLDFSSQSHFASVFKRMEGITPTEFLARSNLI